MVPKTHIQTSRKLRSTLAAALALATLWLLAAQAGALTSVTESLDFGRQPVDLASEPHMLTLMNDTRSEMHFGSAQIDGAQPRDFRIARDGCSETTLPPNARCTMQVRFVPRAAGPSSAELTIPHDDADGSFQASLSGEGFVLRPAAPVTTPVPPTAPVTPRPGPKLACSAGKTQVLCEVWLPTRRSGALRWTLIRHGRVVLRGRTHAHHGTAVIALPHAGRLAHGSYRLRVAGVPRAARVAVA